MKKIALIIISIVLALCTMSCGSLFGPSDKDVMDALNPAWDGFASVPIFQEDMAEEFQYNDTVEMSTENEEQTITQNSTIAVDREENFMTIDGICNFDNFLDNKSGYTINGSIKYNMSGSMEKNSDDMELEFVFDLSYEGGNVKSIAFTMNDTIMQSDELPKFVVNGKNYKFKEELKGDAFRLIKRMKVM